MTATMPSTAAAHAQPLFLGLCGGGSTCAAPSTAERSCCSSAALKRRVGSFSSSRITIWASAGGTSGLRNCGGCTTPSRCWRATVAASGPSKTGVPVSSAYSTSPSLYTSAGAPGARPAASSGLR